MGVRERACRTGSDGQYFIGRIRGGDVAAVGSVPEGAPPMAMWNTYIWVDSADDAAAKARTPAAAVLTEPFDVMDVGPDGRVRRSEGAVFCVWQANQHKGAQVVNEHGALNFNDLATRDPEGAKAFYGAVFGWETLALAGGSDVDAARLRRSPRGGRPRAPRADGRDGRARRASSTSSPRLKPIADDDPDTPPHWSVTFAVDDADATAAKATELGGEVVAGPMDAPWVQDGGDRGPAGRDVHRQPVRPGEQGPRGPVDHDSSGSGTVSAWR